MILIGGGAIRISGISHGVGFHPDERHMVSVVLQLKWEDLNPKSFAYGSLPYYLVFGAKELVAALVDVIGLAETSRHIRSYDGIFVVGRTVCSLVGLLGVVGVFVFCRAVGWPREISLFAALLLAFNVFHIQLSRFFTSDVILTTICTFALLALVRHLQSGGRGQLLLLGLLIGLACATKIAGVILLVLAVPLITMQGWLRNHRITPSIIAAVVLIAISFISFVATNPFAVLDMTTFLAHTGEQLRMVSGDSRPPYAIQYEGTAAYLYPLRQMAEYTIGPVVSLLFLVGAYLSLRTLRANTWIIAIVPIAWCAIFFLATGGSSVKFPRYLLPIYPTVMYVAAVGIFELSRILKKRGKDACGVAARLR